MSYTQELPNIGTFSAEVYNGLMDVGKADKTLHARDDLEAFFQEVGSLICEHDLENRIGLCLLHNHNSVSDEQRMIEIYDEKTYSAPALVMQSMHSGDAPQHVPVVMKVQGGNEYNPLTPLEHSALDIARDNYEQLMLKSEAFLPSFQELVKKRGYEDLVGLSVIRADALPCKEGESFIERTDAARVANVITAEPEREEANTRYITTNWQFEKAGYRAMAECVIKCLAKCTQKVKCVVIQGEHEEWEQGHDQKHVGSGTHS